MTRDSRSATRSTGAASASPAATAPRPPAKPPAVGTDPLPTGGLLLTRRPGEKIVISQSGRVLAVIDLTRIEASANRAQIRTSAPPGVRIDRFEVYHRNQLAALAAGGTVDG